MIAYTHVVSICIITHSDTGVYDGELKSEFYPEKLCKNLLIFSPSQVFKQILQIRLLVLVFDIQTPA